MSPEVTVKNIQVAIVEDVLGFVLWYLLCIMFHVSLSLSLYIFELFYSSSS